MKIELKDLVYAYNKRKVAVNGATAVLNSGTYLLLGENGSGKTTLLHLIAGLLFPKSGDCKVDGVSSSRRDPSTLSKLIFLGAESRFPARDIDTMVRIHAQFYPTFDPEMLKRNLESFGISSSEKLNSMSFGNRHKAMVAYMLSLRTPLVLLDEPATGLDIESKQILQKMLAECVDPDQIIIVSTHNIEDLHRLYDGVIILSGGKLLVSATVDEIMSRISFVCGDEPAPDALHSEQKFGRWFSIVPSDGSGSGEVNYELLYMGLRKSDNNKLLEYLNFKLSDNK